jgi:hypothetical protein
VAEIQIIGRSPDRKSNNGASEVRHFASPEDEASGTSEVTKSREAIRTVHLVGDAWQRSKPSGKVPIGESSIGNHESGYRESRGQEDLHFRIAKSETPKERRAPLCGGQLTSYRRSGYRESRGQSVYAFRHCDVRNPDRETRLRSCEIVVIWARSLARRG